LMGNVIEDNLAKISNVLWGDLQLKRLQETEMP
jgi:hypothetical protein